MLPYCVLYCRLRTVLSGSVVWAGIPAAPASWGPCRLPLRALVAVCVSAGAVRFPVTVGCGLTPFSADVAVLTCRAARAAPRGCGKAGSVMGMSRFLLWWRCSSAPSWSCMKWALRGACLSTSRGRCMGLVFVVPFEGQTVDWREQQLREDARNGRSQQRVGRLQWRAGERRRRRCRWPS